jgi:hypothetical protein
VALNGESLDGVELIRRLNRIGGAHGVGLVDLVENRVVGMKSRGVYETPGGAILYYAHQELEHLCLDRQTYAFNQTVARKMGELIYGGLWFSPLRECLSVFVDAVQAAVSGGVRVKLYKGSISAAGASSPYSLYNASLASFTTGELYDHADARGFIRLYGLPALVRALMEQGGGKPAPAKLSLPKRPVIRPRAAAIPEDAAGEAPPAAPKKRGRKPGSGKKAPAGAPAEAAGDAPVVKRRGRPKGSVSANKAAPDAAPKKRGRKPGSGKKAPAGAPAEAAGGVAVVKRRGRPKGSVSANKAAPDAAPKKRGRKPGSGKKAAAAPAAPPETGKKPGPWTGEVILIKRQGSKQKETGES